MYVFYKAATSKTEKSIVLGYWLFWKAATKEAINVVFGYFVYFKKETTAKTVKKKQTLVTVCILKSRYCKDLQKYSLCILFCTLKKKKKKKQRLQKKMFVCLFVVVVLVWFLCCFCFLFLIVCGHCMYFATKSAQI